MRVHHLRCGGALLLILAIAGASATRNVENPSGSTERKVRYQRKVLVSRSPVTNAPSPTPAQATQPPTPAQATQPPTPAQAQPTQPPTPAQPAIPAHVSGTADDSAENARATRSAAEAAQDRWVRYVTDYVNGPRAGSEVSGIPNWPKNPIKLDLPVFGEGSSRGRSSTVPVFVLPVPIPIQQECSADRDRPEKYDLNLEVYNRRGDNRPRPSSHPRKPVTDEHRGVYDEPEREKPRKPVYEEPPRLSEYDEPRRPSYETRRPSYEEPRRPSYEEPRRPSYEEPRRPSYEEPRRPSYEEPRRPSYEEPRRPSYEKPRRPYVDYEESRPYVPSRPTPFTKPEPKYKEPSTLSPPNMHSGGPVDSEVLVELFRVQQPRAPELPAVLTRHRRHADSPPPLPPARPAIESPVGEPQKPRFDRPLAVRGSLTVHRADYTEAYTAWWDPITGNSRVDFSDGATSTYRTMQGYSVHRVAMSYDRTGEKDVPRCSTMQDKPASAADRAPPMLPDMQPFSFYGYVELDGVQAEQWKHTVSGRPGEGGGARGEALTYRHEMLLARCNDTLKPIMYSVSVDSSVLGPECDRYVHRYHEVHEHKPDASLFQFDIARECSSVEETEDMSVVEPLREFTMMERDPRYDELFKQFSIDYERKYIDSAEEAVRKNLLTQTTRFVLAGNRLGATFEMALNFLSDRLDAEVEVLLGVELDDEHFPAESFPHERSKLRDLADRLPDEFDWRQRGGVSPVEYQGSCSSCWAFAVAGAVEGALFRKTRRLVPLSEQCLVDCSQPYGGNGCKGTWPSHAYDYVQDRGLPAKKEYIPYMARVLECQDKVAKPVTQISAHVNVTEHSVPALKVAIRRHAPSVVIIDSSLKSFVAYKKGVFYDDRCAKVKNKLKHAVLAVGWGQQRGEPHFILKNSWSAAWGDGGFMRMHGPSNTCGVLTLPSYPRLEAGDVLRDLDPLAAPAPASAAAPAGRNAAASDEEDD